MNYIKEDAFNSNHREKTTALFTLKNKNGLVAQMTNFGAKIVSIFVPDNKGTFADIVLGYETIDGYIKGNPYFGAICGRYANRIANGKFVIEGRTYQLPVNNGPNSLHGGPEGFNNQVFNAGKTVKTNSQIAGKFVAEKTKAAALKVWSIKVRGCILLI